MNYHLFIVDEISLKFHLEYGFVGTGNSNQNFNIGLWKDIARLKIDDKIIFYVQKNKKNSMEYIKYHLILFLIPHIIYNQ